MDLFSFLTVFSIVLEGIENTFNAIATIATFAEYWAAFSNWLIAFGSNVAELVTSLG